MSKEEFIAYQGAKYIVEWFYDENGRSRSLGFYKSLSMDERIKIMQLFKCMGDAGVIKDTTKFNFEGDQIYAFKPQSNRFLCFFFRGGKIIVTNGFKKKQQKLPPNEKQMALKLKVDYEKRVKEGQYYE